MAYLQKLGQPCTYKQLILYRGQIIFTFQVLLYDPVLSGSSTARNSILAVEGTLQEQETQDTMTCFWAATINRQRSDTSSSGSPRLHHSWLAGSRGKVEEDWGAFVRGGRKWILLLLHLFWTHPSTFHSSDIPNHITGVGPRTPIGHLKTYSDIFPDLSCPPLEQLKYHQWGRIGLGF